MSAAVLGALSGKQDALHELLGIRQCAQIANSLRSDSLALLMKRITDAKTSFRVSLLGWILPV